MTGLLDSARLAKTLTNNDVRAMTPVGLSQERALAIDRSKRFAVDPAPA